MREIQRYRVSKMAEPAMLVFKGLFVPVAGCLKGKRQYECGHYNGHDPIRRSPVLEQLHTPAR